MSSKEEYCFRVMRKYGLLVDFDGDAATINVPRPLDGDETLSNWKKRVLGPDVSNVTVYFPDVINGRRKLSNLQAAVGADHLRNVVRAHSKVKNTLAEVRIGSAVEKVTEKYKNYSKDMLKELTAELGDTLEASVNEFFKRLANEMPDNIDAEALIKKLIISYNKTARICREMRTPVDEGVIPTTSSAVKD